MHWQSLKIAFALHGRILLEHNSVRNTSFYAPNFEKVGDILVSACPYVCVYSCSRSQGFNAVTVGVILYESCY